MIMSADNAINELFSKMPKPISVQDFITNIISVYPKKLNNLKLIKKENGMEIINFPFNPPITPIEFIIQEALTNATMQTQQKVNNGIYTASANNQIGMLIINSLTKNKETIEGETGISLETLLQKECIVEKENNNSGLIVADAQGNVEGDTIKIIVDF